MVDAREKALSLLKHRDKTVKEIREALTRAGFKEREIEDTIESFVDMGYLNDKSYTERYVEISIEKKRGPLRIRRELEAKGIDISTVENVLDDQYDNELEQRIAKSITENMIQKNSSLSKRKLTVKIINKLSYEGFGDDVINIIADELFE